MKTTRPTPTKIRPFTDAELRAMNPSRDSGGLGCFLAFFVAIGGGLFTVIKVSDHVPGGVRGLPTWEGLAIFAAWIIPLTALGFWLEVRTSGPRKKSAPKLKQPTDAVAEVFTFSAVAAIRVEEFEDEGSHYFLHLTDGKVLFLSGQYLYEYDTEDEEAAPGTKASKKRFPCTEFNVIRHSKSGYVIKINCRGTYLAPEKVLKAFNAKFYEQDKVPQDMTYVDLAWGQIEATYS